MKPWVIVLMVVGCLAVLGILAMVVGAGIYLWHQAPRTVVERDTFIPETPPEPLSDEELLTRVLGWDETERELALNELVRRGRPTAEALIAAFQIPDSQRPDVEMALIRFRRDSPDPELRALATEALKSSVFPRTVKVNRTESDYDRQYRQALHGTPLFGTNQVPFQYQAGLEHTIGVLEVETKTVADLMALLEEENPGARAGVVDLVAELAPRMEEEFSASLYEAMKNEARRYAAVRCLVKIGGKDSVPLFVAALRDPNPVLLSAGLEGIQQLGVDASDAVGPLMALYPGVDHGTRVEILRAISAVGPAAQEAVAFLTGLTQDPETLIADEALSALNAIRPPPGLEEDNP